MAQVQMKTHRLWGNMSELYDRLDELAEQKLQLVKTLLEVELAEANFKIIKARIRGGKVQRRRKVSTRPGYTIRGGKLVRMSSQERQKRKQAARRSKSKRKAKLKRALQKRKMSLRKRRSL